MKRFLLVIVLLIVAWCVYAQDGVFQIHGHLELGVFPNFRNVEYEVFNIYKTEKDVGFYLDMGLEFLLYNHFFIGGGLRTYAFKNDKINFIPFYCDYSFTAGIRVKWFEVGFRHYCFHPVSAGVGYGSPMLNIDKSYEEIYVRVEF